MYQGLYCFRSDSICAGVKGEIPMSAKTWLNVSGLRRLTGGLAARISPGLSTYSTMAIGALSPFRCFASFRTRVYPPSRSWYLGPSTSNSFVKAGFSRTIRLARWRAATVPKIQNTNHLWEGNNQILFPKTCFIPSLPNLMILSANNLTSLALGTVVWIRSWTINDVTIFLNIAHLCFMPLPIFLYFNFFMVFLTER